MDVRIPDFYVPFPLERNPLLPHASVQMWQWIEDVGLAPTRRARSRMMRTGADVSGAYVWPRASLPTLALGLKWLALTFRIDDQLDEDDYHERWDAHVNAITELKAVLDDTGEPTSSVVASALSALWAHTAAGHPESWRAVFVADFGAFLDSYAAEARLDATHTAVALDAYLDRRMFSIGMPWLWDLGELALPALLPDSVRTSEQLHRLRRAAALHIAMVNDVYSLERENVVGYRHNAVLIVQERNGGTVQEAVDAVAAMAAGYAREFIQQRTSVSQLLAAQSCARTRDVVNAYVDNLAANMRGQLAWHGQVQRYSTDDLKGEESTISRYPDDLLR